MYSNFVSVLSVIYSLFCQDFRPQLSDRNLQAFYWWIPADLISKSIQSTTYLTLRKRKKYVLEGGQILSWNDAQENIIRFSTKSEFSSDQALPRQISTKWSFGSLWRIAMIHIKGDFCKNKTILNLFREETFQSESLPIRQQPHFKTTFAQNISKSKFSFMIKEPTYLLKPTCLRSKFNSSSVTTLVFLSNS